MTEEIDLQNLFLDYESAKSRLILLDYDGTLIPFDIHPDLTVPDATVKSVIRSLATDAKNQVMIISGRDREHFDVAWRDVPIAFAAEHGGYYKNVGGEWQTFFSIETGWIPKALHALRALSLQYKGSHVEQKTYSIAWHYRAIATEIVDSDLQRILTSLRSLPEQEQFHIYHGEYTIELRAPEIDKGSFAARWMGNKKFDFIMAMGDSQTDEDLFRILSDDAWTIKVGQSDYSFANVYLKSQESVTPLLRRLVNISSELNNKIF
jgi:trehalose 6-phosphate synthase/phosphatase